MRFTDKVYNNFAGTIYYLNLLEAHMNAEDIIGNVFCHIYKDMYEELYYFLLKLSYDFENMGFRMYLNRDTLGEHMTLDWNKISKEFLEK